MREGRREAHGRRETLQEIAEMELEKAVKEYPDFSAAWYLLGEARVIRNEPEEAREALRKAIETDPGF